MDTSTQQKTTKEFAGSAMSGGMMLAFNLGLIIAGVALFIYGTSHYSREFTSPGYFIVGGIILPILGLILLTGHFTLEPNEARVLVLFGAYKGTVRESGFYWANAFYSRGQPPMALRMQLAQAQAQEQTKGRATPAAPAQVKSRFKISLRARTLNMNTLKVNDKRGNPVEIAAIIVWQVVDTARAAFDVDDLDRYVVSQSESALRHVASAYTYDDSHTNEPTLRSNVEEVSKTLMAELQQRLVVAGVVVADTRLSHLAYAPEIAQVMLRRQQAEAVVAARQIIVHNAVSMVEMALHDLAEKNVVNLDDERKAAMVSNLLVVLCSEAETTPVINTGTLYS